MPKLEVEKSHPELAGVYFGSSAFDRRSCQRFIDDSVKESRRILIELGHDPFYSQDEHRAGFNLKDSVKYPSQLPVTDRDRLLAIFLPAALGYARNYHAEVKNTIGGVEESDFQFIAVDALQATVAKFDVTNNRSGAFLIYLRKAVNSKISNFLTRESMFGATLPKEPDPKLPVDLNGNLLEQDLNSTFSHHQLNEDFFEELKTTRAMEVLKRSIPESGAHLENFQMLLAYHGLDLQFTESEPLSYEQISAKFGAPINTVGTKIHRAKNALRQALTSSFEQEVIQLGELNKANAA